jgi:hypothetical protein
MAAQPPSTLRCVTCNKDYAPDAKAIHSRLPDFEDWCVCWECVNFCQKRGPVPELKSGD